MAINGIRKLREPDWTEKGFLSKIGAIITKRKRNGRKVVFC